MPLRVAKRTVTMRLLPPALRQHRKVPQLPEGDAQVVRGPGQGSSRCSRLMPRGSRGDFDSKDLVQEAALRMLKRRSLFEPRHAYSVHAYLRRTVLNLVRDEARRHSRRPQVVAICEDLPCDQTGPLEITLRQERRARYEKALRTLRPKDQRLIAARIEGEQHVNEIARIFGLPSSAAARVAVARALSRLRRNLRGMK